MDTVNVVVGDTTLNMATHVTEDIALGVGDNFLTFLDENSSVVFKGVIDPNGTFLIDPSQFVNILLDQSQAHGQSFLDTSNPLTIQMVQPPPGVSLGGKSMMNENVSYSTTGKLGHLKSFQIQNHATPSDVLSAKCYGSTQLTSANAQDSVSPVAIPRFLTPTTAPGLTEIFVQKTPKRNDALIKITDTVAELREDNSDMLARETSFICNVCSEVFSGYQQLRKHKATHVDEKPFRCSQCNMEFNFEINLKLHSIIHEAEESGNLHCKVCLAKFSRLASLKSHLRTHEKEENLVCNECGEEVPTLAKLNDHMEEHNTRVQQCMVYRCKLCGKTFNSQALLRDHSKGHAEVRKELKIFARQKPRSKSRQKLASESASWTPNKSKKKRVCSVCSKAFDKPSQLERHFRVHSGAKPFQCSYPDCNKCFNQKVTLESHVLACHQRLKPFKCHMCNICFSQRGNLKSHIIKVHIPSGENDKVFKCEECACVYRRLATLNHHIARVHSVVSKEEFPSLPSNPETDQSAPDSASRKLVEPTPCPSATVETPVTNKPETDQVEEPSLVSDEATTSEVSTNKAPDQLTETIHEVNCIYADSVGVPRRCLLKVKKVGQKKYHLCPACPKSFRKPSDLIRHIRVHTLERPYVCNICTKSFAVKSTLSTHLKTHDLIKRLSCSVCQKKFSTLSSLKSHERLHTGAKPFQCMQCGKQFRTSTQRRVHQKTHTRNALGLTGRRKLLRIGDVKPSIRLPDPLKITSGGLVPVPNRIVRTTVNGLPIDQTSRPYRCTHVDCTSSFKKSSHLKQHALSHSGERPYKCLQCHRNFISSGVLKNHIKTHEGVRAYSCDQCHFAFTTNGSLKRHMATHLDERLFVCPYCARTFKTSVATRKHIKVHRNETVPPNSSFHDLGKQPKGIMLINQNSASEYPQQFSDVQIYDASELTNIYGSEFNDMSQVLANQLNLEVSRQEGEDRSIGSNPTPELHVPATENVLEESTVIACHDSVVLHHPGRDSILEYTLLASTISSQEDTTENLDLPLDQEPNFDPSIFTLQLQQGESLDLQFLQDSQGIGNDSTCLNQIVSYEFETPSVEHLSESENVSENECALQDKKETIRPTPLATTSPPSCTKKKKSSTVTKHKAPNVNNAEDSVEVRNLQEVSRPISEQLYTELATQPYQRRLKTEMRPGNLDETVGNKDCPICGTKFKKKSDLDRHYLIHTGEKPYRCSICGKSFRVKSTRQAHMRTHDEKKKTVACHVCQNLFSTKSSLRVHLRSHLNLKPYPCPFPNCTRQFRTSGHRKSHIQSHFKQAKKRKIDGGNGFSKTKGSLPSVQTIKDHQNSSSTIDKQIEQLEQRVQTMLETSTMEVPDSNAHLVSSAQLQFDGVQFTNLDMSSLQVDDSFLQNVTNVIFLPSGNQGGEVVDGTNVIIGMLPGQELPPSSELPYNILGSGIQLTGDQLDNGAVTLSDNIHQYIIHNNEMMSSTARPNTGGNEGQNYILPSASQEFLCSTCHVPFQSKIKLDKHEKTHALVPKPFKCSICPRSFVQKGSFEVHFKTHSKEKVEFVCPLCPYLTQRKPNLKTHFSRAHPNNMEQFNQVIGSISKVGKS